MVFGLNNPDGEDALNAGMLGGEVCPHRAAELKGKLAGIALAGFEGGGQTKVLISLKELPAVLMLSV